MKVVIFGSTGGTGRLLIERVLQAGHTATAFARDTSAIRPQPGLTIVKGTVSDAASVEAAIAGQDAVLSGLGGRPWRTAPVCGPAIHNIVAAMTKHGVRRIVATSTQGAGDTRGHVGWMARTFLFDFVLRNEVADKEAMEQHLEASDLDWTVVRVGILTSNAARGTFRAADDGSICGMAKIARADVANFIVAQLKDKTWIRRMPVIMY
jgi:putative NADH-flavin reductase